MLHTRGEGEGRGATDNREQGGGCCGRGSTTRKHLLARSRKLWRSGEWDVRPRLKTGDRRLSILQVCVLYTADLADVDGLTAVQAVDPGSALPVQVSVGGVTVSIVAFQAVDPGSALPVQLSVGGVTVSIVAFQAVDPGSTPGQRIFFAF